MGCVIMALTNLSHRTFACALLLGLSAALPVAGSAQITDRFTPAPRVPSPEKQRLNRAKIELAKRPKSLKALLEAGNAAAEAGEFDAAFAYFARAQAIEPSNPGIDLGLASAYLRSGRPVSALPLLAAAEAAGAKDRALFENRALALDMVGDQRGAQDIYQRLLQASPDDTDLMRRLALSHAITGNNAQFEAVLRPLVEKRDFAAFRTRAFGLAIMGEQNRAAAIVDAVMPRQLARKITPYLEYMPQLTPAQQAAAANLGIFPRSADIGKDSPAILAYAGRGVAAARASAPDEPTADARLEPVGEPFGQMADGDGLTDGIRIVEVNTANSATGTAAALAQTAPADSPTSVLANGAVVGPPAYPPSEPSAAPITGPVAAPGTGPVMLSAAPEPAIEPPAAARVEPEQPASVADAFADLASSMPTPDPVSEGGVDLTTIEVPIEERPVAKPDSKEPEHPRRIWVQVATGRDIKALGFDWRRLSRKSGGLLGDYTAHSTPWGQANRLLAGPIDTKAKARDLVNALSEKGIDTFTFTSSEGMEIQRLK